MGTENALCRSCGAITEFAARPHRAEHEGWCLGAFAAHHRPRAARACSSQSRARSQAAARGWEERYLGVSEYDLFELFAHSFLRFSDANNDEVLRREQVARYVAQRLERDGLELIGTLHRVANRLL